jgi:hypothetical protein
MMMVQKRIALSFIVAGGLLGSSVASAGPELVAYPEGYKDTFTQYATVNRDDDRKQVVHIFANDVALGSAKDGAPLDHGSVLTMEVYKAELDESEKPVMGDDGYFVAGDLAAVVVMESQDGFGADYADDLRNGTWEYALFKGDGSRIDKETTACFECHKPLHDTDYVFSFDQLVAAGE